MVASKHVTKTLILFVAMFRIIETLIMHKEKLVNLTQKMRIDHPTLHDRDMMFEIVLNTKQNFNRN